MSEKRDPHLRKACSLPEPYPKPKVTGPNLFYANLLLEDYSGVVSEMTAINQYIYHHFTFHGPYENLAELEECISLIEMKHLELLAETILLLGVAPEFRTYTANYPVYWNASYVYYGVDVCDRLSADITAETQAIHNYCQHQQLIEDPHIKNLLERIIMDERHHLELFRTAMGNLNR
ncbi:MAG TPA: manganese catalase family protein [Bacillota bacterium]|nr:manganese catalase family protein [Bacillota bacterium]